MTGEDDEEAMVAACAVITFLPTGQSGFSASADGWGAATPRVLHYLVILAEPPQNPPNSAKIFNGVAKLIHIKKTGIIIILGTLGFLDD